MKRTSMRWIVALVLGAAGLAAGSARADRAQAPPQGLVGTWSLGR